MFVVHKQYLHTVLFVLRSGNDTPPTESESFKLLILEIITMRERN